MFKINCGSILRLRDLYNPVQKVIISKRRFLIIANYYSSSRINLHTQINARCFCHKAVEDVENNLEHKKQNEVIDIAAISNGDPEQQHKLKVIILETEVMRQEGINVPSSSFMKTEHWTELLGLPSKSRRRKYLEFLFKLEKKTENREKKKIQKRLEKEKILPEEDIDDGTLKYGLRRNSMFLRIYDTTINNFYNSRLIEAMKFGQKLILDCGFDSHMTKYENRLCAKQLMLLFGENRLHDDPFDIHLCNANSESVLMQAFHKHINTLYEPWFPLSVHQQSYLDLFPKENLVYLTPHCREEMKTFDHNSIYIIGGIVDKCIHNPLSLAKAKKEGIRVSKLPLDSYLVWNSGSGKTLTLNHVVSILLDVKSTGDWNYAFRHVPKRKIVDFSSDNHTTHIKDRNRTPNPIWKPEMNVKVLRYNKKASLKNNSSDVTRKTIKIKNNFQH